MKKIFRILSVVSLFVFVSCQMQEDDPVKSVGDGFVLKGNATLQTKTSFGTPSDEAIPFLWDENDVIYVNGIESNPLAEGGATAEFTFSSGSVTEGDKVFYGYVDGDNVWTLPWQYGTAKRIDGDFGYAVVGDDNSFTLEHYTSYIWLNTFSSEVSEKVVKVVITAENNIVGSAPFNTATKKFDSISSIDPDDELLSSTNSIVLEFMDENWDSAPLRLLNASSDEHMWALAVTFPVITGALRVDYHFEDGKLASFNYPSNSLESGKTYKISQEINQEDLYELKVLTFEDDDVQFSSYSLDYCSAEISSWSDLVAADQYMDELIYSFSQTEGDYYNWNDENNTFLAHHFPYNYSSYCYWGGGHAISNYVSSDYETYGDYMSQLTVYNGDAAEELAQEGGGHNNSNNFCMHFGYIDGSQYNQTDELSSIYFSDGISRVIDHMWVANNTYAINCFINGNGLTDEMGEDDKFYVTASGFDENGTFVASTTIYLAKGKNYLSKWTKWDLSSLGKVASVQFNVCGTSDNGFGFSQPAYFAYDDVAVRF